MTVLVEAGHGCSLHLYVPKLRTPDNQCGLRSSTGAALRRHRRPRWEPRGTDAKPGCSGYLGRMTRPLHDPGCNSTIPEVTASESMRAKSVSINCWKVSLTNPPLTRKPASCGRPSKFVSVLSRFIVQAGRTQPYCTMTMRNPLKNFIPM